MTKGFVKLTGVALLSLVCVVLSTVVGFAQSHPVEGTYAVTANSSELGTLNFQMTFKRNSDKWTVEVKDSPTPLAVSSVTVNESNLVTINADAGGTAVTIIGKFDGKKIAGDWSAGDVKGTWSAVKNDVAAAPANNAAGATTAVAGGATASKVAAAGLEGSYDAKVIADGQGELAFTLVIKKDGEKLVTEVQGGGDLNVVGIEAKDPDVVNLTATYQGNGPIPLPGKRTGDELGGKWEFGGFSGSWSAKKKK